MNRLSIIFEDRDLLVVNKPAGLVVHEGSGQSGPTLVDLLVQHLPGSPLQQDRYGLLHRLDKGTSGLLLVAKTRLCFDYLKDLFKRRKVTKEYLVLVEGKISPRKGIIKVPLARDVARRTQFSPKASGKIAETAYEVIKYIGSLTYLKAIPKTGRTHQIRVHFAGLGHPIVGDKVYGRKRGTLDRQFLHAHKLSFVGPTGPKREFIAPLPEELNRYLNEVE